MPRLALSSPRRALLAPARVGLLRAVLEGAVGCVVLLGLAAAVGVLGGEIGFRIAAPLTLAWLTFWPAWRLRRVQGDGRWRRIRWGLGRALLAAFLLCLVGLLLGALEHPLLPAAATLVPILFLCARAVTLVAATVLRHARRRLRWQLTLSHLVVIVLTFMALTAVGSVNAVYLVLRAVQPNARLMATSVADTLRVATNAGALQRQRAQVVLDGIEAGRLQIQGEPPLPAALSHPLVPSRILLVSPSGAVLAAAVPPHAPPHTGTPRATTPLPAATWQRLRHQLGSGRTTTLQLRTPLWPDSAPPMLGASPLVDASGRVLAVAVVQVAHAPIVLTTSQVLAVALAVFGVATLILISLTWLPILALSSLFGYLLARGLTRRLEALSQVTTAIAAGDLTQRAPVNAENEVGRLAEDVNRMAAHLEKAMGDLRQARAQAVEALRARQELVANVSHELRTPLAVVRAHLDTLAMRQPASAGMAGAREREVTVPETTLQALQNETERLAALVEDLFALSRARTGELQAQVRCEPIDVAALIDDVAALMRPLAQQESKITLSVQTPPGLPPALADPDRLRQILENLVRNAVRHTPDGGIIALSVAAEGPWIAVSVADTGEGISPEHLPHIFERFYRVDQARTRSSGGAGLGLAIVREFVELMGGHVTVESKLGEGSCFRVFLPCAASTRVGRQ